MAPNSKFTKRFPLSRERSEPFSSAAAKALAALAANGQRKGRILPEVTVAWACGAPLPGCYAAFSVLPQWRRFVADGRFAGTTPKTSQPTTPRRANPASVACRTFFRNLRMQSSPMPSTREEIAAAICQLASGTLADQMIDSLRRSVRITLREANEDLFIGQSRFGGWPDVSANFEWPMCVGLPTAAAVKIAQRSARSSSSARFSGSTYQKKLDAYKPLYDPPKPLSLLAQINLAELPSGWDIGLPSAGQFLVFCDVDDEIISGGYDEPHDRWHVCLLDDSPEPLVEMVRPGDDAERRPAIRGLNFLPEWTISDELQYHADSELSAMFNRVREMLEHHGWPRHRLLGHAQPIQGQLAYAAELTFRHDVPAGEMSEAEIEATQRRWRSLLQLGEEENKLNWSWGDIGQMHFMILNEDLENSRFDRVTAELQCH